MNRALGFIVGLPGPITAQQIDLQMIQRIEIGKPVANTTRQGRVVFQEGRGRSEEHTSELQSQ